MNAAAPPHGGGGSGGGGGGADLPPSAHPNAHHSVLMQPAAVAAATAAATELKRKRTPSDPPPASHKTQKTTLVTTTSASAPSTTISTPPTANANAHHLAINYLARQFHDDLPLISTDDSLPSILHLLGEYQGVLERHESMACNLGARPLGPILIKRFERMFDGPPRILKNHGKEGNTVTWLDVVDFARSKPEQFVLGQMSEGMRVCQIHTKQCRVQISEEDFMLINSGMPQKLIPPQPIVEDEEKELGTLEILDKNLTSISHLADQVAARTRQLKHRINGRRQAILERRANEPGPVIRGTSPSVLNGSGVSIPSPSQYNESNGRPAEYSKTGASASTKSELLSKFFTQAEKERREAERVNGISGEPQRASTSGPSHTPRVSSGSIPQHPSSSSSNQYRDIHPRDGAPYNGYGSANTPDRGFNAHLSKFRQTPSTSNTYGDTISVHAFSVPQSSATAGVIKEVKSENDGPYRAEMVVRMEALKKGDRVLPPCDRCRRLHMDCIKNLTACAGCTKKHAKCSWRDVRESELWGPEKGKVPIPAAAAQGGELDTPGRERGEREHSVGLRPTDHASVQLLQALGGGAEHTHHQHHNGNGGFTRDPRALALEGLTAAEQHQQNGHTDSHLHAPGSGHGNGGGSEYHNSPQTPQRQHTPLTGFPSRPPSASDPHPLPYVQQQHTHYAPYETPPPPPHLGPPSSLPLMREEIGGEKVVGV